MSFPESLNDVCPSCCERFCAPDERYCSNCLMFHEEIDERDCPACGSALSLDGSCVCPLGPSGDPYWVDKRR